MIYYTVQYQKGFKLYLLKTRWSASSGSFVGQSKEKLPKQLGERSGIFLISPLYSGSAYRIEIRWTKIFKWIVDAAFPSTRTLKVIQDKLCSCLHWAEVWPLTAQNRN